MTRGLAERKHDVLRLVEAARAVANERASIVEDLIATTGLSREGVELGFTRHLELQPSDAEIEALVASAGDAKHVVVILSANVFVAPLRAIALARAASPSVVIRPSRRDPPFARALVARAADPGLSLVDEIDLPRLFGGEVHVYGRDSTIAEVRARVGERIRVRGHGAGMGVALVSPAASLEVAASALAGDVIAFDQRGCLSPRVAIVIGDSERAERFASALSLALTLAGARVPRGIVHADERAEASRYEATLSYAGRVIVGADHVVGVGPAGAPLVVPPPARHVHVVPAASEHEARRLLEPLRAVLVSFGCDDAPLAARVAPPHARRSSLGEMQRPPLDGPVDLRDHGA
jgi:hypothetical protein